MEIPWKLHIALIKLQGALESSYEEACIKASGLLDVNSEEFQKAVEVAARNLEKSSVMSKVNKRKMAWVDKGYQKGIDAGYEKGVVECQIKYPCSVCGEDLIMIPGNPDHVALIGLMRGAGWGHSSCHTKK